MSDFSTKQYSWKDLSIAMAGRILEGATDVEYTEKIEKGAIYGRGNKPHSIGTGNVSYDGKLEMWQSDYEAMVRDAKSQGKTVLDLEFDLTVCYEPKDGSPIVTDILVGCQFTEVKKGLKQGDKNQLISLPIIFLSVKPQA